MEEGRVEKVTGVYIMHTPFVFLPSSLLYGYAGQRNA